MTHPFDGTTLARLSERTGEPAWLAERRREALARFEALRWPDQALEEWRNTDIRGLDLGAFDALPAQHAAVGGLGELADDVRALAIGDRGDRHGLAVQVDADVVHCRLAPAAAERGVVFAPLERAAADHPDLVQEWLGRAGASEHEGKLVSLNAAMASGGIFVYVPRGVAIEKPLQSVRWINGGLAVFPRVVIVAEEGASVTYIDSYGGADLERESLAVASVEVYAQQGANVGYLSVQDWPQQVWHFGVQRALIERDATLRTLAATLGGALSRQVAQGLLRGPGAHAEMLGVYFGDRAQHIDNRTLQLHDAPHTTSDLLYKGALKGTSRAIYTGLVDIEKEARGSDATQLNRNLLLSAGASALPDPFLEIKTSEVVRATHGVSVGRPDENVMFYLRSRGLDRDEAERVYVKGYFQEIIDRVTVPEIRATLEAAVEHELALED